MVTTMIFSLFPFSVNYFSALLFLLLANISGFFVFFNIGLENIFLNLASGGKRRVKVANLGFEKDCNNIIEDNSNNNNYNSCVFVNGIIKVIFVYVVVCCITGPSIPPDSLFFVLFSLLSLSLFFTFLTSCSNKSLSRVFKPHPLASTCSHKLR